MKPCTKWRWWFPVILQADVLDESQSALTPQTVEANREEIMTFERHQHLLMKKQGTR
ncbi:hypothetical protein [Bacterioplanoides sp.]|uniref:hypothetical protein n=1 Tax=Bacterioplanoides sp. TaxID=2066072 RepID=UPI003AFFAA5D